MADWSRWSWLPWIAIAIACSEPPPAELSLQQQFPPRQNGKISDRFPDLELTTQHGETVHFYADLVRGRTVIVNLMYTSCTDI